VTPTIGVWHPCGEARPIGYARNQHRTRTDGVPHRVPLSANSRAIEPPGWEVGQPHVLGAGRPTPPPTDRHVSPLARHLRLTACWARISRPRVPADRQVSPFRACQSNVDSRLTPSPTRGSGSGGQRSEAPGRPSPLTEKSDELVGGQRQRCPVRKTDRKRRTAQKLPKPHSLLRAIRMSPSPPWIPGANRRHRNLC
jgi:hypothetical protein